MNKSKVLEYIRRDGKTDAPILFLTIEDGGGFESIHDFRDYFESDGVWQPEAREPTKLGKPGIIIPKIILGITKGDFEGWQLYRDKYLYLENELNLKFYPIARPQTSVWRDLYSEYVGLTSEEYINKCLEVRPDIIWARYDQCITNAKLIVILGELQGWKNLLQSKKGITIVNEDIEHDKKGNLKWAFYYSKGGNLEFTYFNMFRWGVKDVEILEYCAKLKETIPTKLIDELYCNLENHNSQFNSYVTKSDTPDS